VTGLSAFIQSLSVAGIAEFGDKSQLMAFVLAVRFRRPLPILCGVFLGTFVSDAVGVFLGKQAGELLPPNALPWIVALSFAAIAVWMLNAEDWLDGVNVMVAKSSILLTAFLSGLVAEFGDRTDVAAVLLGVRFDAFLPVVLGTAVGGVLADVPAVLAGHWAGRHFNRPWMRYVAAAAFMIEAVLSFTPYARWG